MNGRCVCVVPFREQPGVFGRREGAKIVLDELRRSGFYVLLVEQGDQTKAGDIPRDGHVLVPDPQPLFRRPFMLNLAWKILPDEQRMAVCESDVLVETHAWVRAADLLSEFDLVSPYTSYWMTRRDASDAFYASKGSGDLSSLRRGADDHARGTHVARCGGGVLMTRRGWQASGGWDEGVQWLGADDLIQGHKVMRLGITNALVPYTGYHLFHDRPSWGCDRQLRRKNNAYWQSWERLNRDQVRARVQANDYSRTPLLDGSYRWLSR